MVVMCGYIPLIYPIPNELTDIRKTDYPNPAEERKILFSEKPLANPGGFFVSAKTRRGSRSNGNSLNHYHAGELPKPPYFCGLQPKDQIA
jgi:hypothetical protein